MKSKKTDLLADKLFNDISPEASQELTELINTNSDDKKLCDTLDSIKVSSRISEIGKEMKADILSDVNRRIDRNLRKIRLYRITAVAACLAVIISLSFFIFYPSPSEKEIFLSVLDSADADVEEIYIISDDNHKIVDNDQDITQTREGDIIVGNEKKLESADIHTEYITIIVPKGKRTSITFSDGSKAWINSGSKLVYPKSFDKKTRDIFLDGEIFIDVAKDTEKPFYVHTKKMDVKVLGTQFNVNAYGEERSNAVVLIKGSVEIEVENQKKLLKPNQGLFYENGMLEVKNVDVYPYISWKDGILQLQGEEFGDLLKKLSRYYGLEIYAEENIYKWSFEGKLNLKDSITDVLHYLSVSKPFTYTLVGNKIFLKE